MRWAADTAVVNASSLLQLPGAVAADAPDVGVAGHYGDPLREQRSLATGPAFVDRSHRGVVVVTGPDRLAWLHSLTTQHFEGLRAGEAVEALVLSPTGHVEHQMDVLDDGERTWLLVEPETAERLTEWLESMRFMMRVEVHDATGELATLTVSGDVDDLLEALPVRPSLVRRRAWPDGTVDVLLPRGELDGVVVELRAHGFAAAGHDAFEAARVEVGAARLHVDTDPRTIPHEAGWVARGVHLAKGCYRGQETVARVHNLGRPPRRLTLLHLDGSGHVLPPRGADVTDAAGDVVGTLTSVVRHYELGPLGLARLRRSVAPDTPLFVSGISASVERDLASPTSPVDLSSAPKGLASRGLAPKGPQRGVAR